MRGVSAVEEAQVPTSVDIPFDCVAGSQVAEDLHRLKGRLAHPLRAWQALVAVRWWVRCGAKTSSSVALLLTRLAVQATPAKYLFFMTSEDHLAELPTWAWLGPLLLVACDIIEAAMTLVYHRSAAADWPVVCRTLRGLLNGPSVAIMTCYVVFVPLTPFHVMHRLVFC